MSAFIPTASQLASRLPARLCEEVRQRESAENVRGPMRSRGYPCPRCRSTNTMFVGNRNVTRKRPASVLGDSKSSFQAPTWECQTATLRDSDSKIPCVACPVCLPEAGLQASLRHRCAGKNGEELLVAAGKKCLLCDYVGTVACQCPECLQEPHAKSFQLIFTWNPAQPNARSQCLAAAGPTVRDCTDLPIYMSQHAEYQTIVQEAERKRRRISFTGVPSGVSSALSGIFHLDDGLKLFSDLQRTNPTALINMGAPDSLISSLTKATSSVPLPALESQPMFTSSSAATSKVLAKAQRRVGDLLSGCQTTLLSRGLGPVRQPTMDQAAILKENSNEMLKAHLRSEGFPEEEIEALTLISEGVENFVVPSFKNQSIDLSSGTPSGMRMASQSLLNPVSSSPNQSQYQSLSQDPGNIDSTAVGKFIRAVRDKNLQILTSLAESQDEHACKQLYKRNKKSFECLARLNGTGGDQRSSVFHDAAVYDDLIWSPDLHTHEKSLKLLNFFIANVNKDRSAGEKLDPIRASLLKANDWDDDDWDDDD